MPQQGRRLSKLALEGVEIVDYDAYTPFILFQALADEVTVSSIAEPMPCDCDTAIFPDEESAID
ncbi:hypothetical protein AURDEDRAFT_110034 [Auricularia subglabra TFB-10046 SS5]|nr:hypothetical protein AURDEDRAFT_110034 [Auricularia subglabra TFB-10046 SS5]